MCIRYRYAAAENGDILYLAEGNFILDGGKQSIKKLLSIVGSGYNSHILGTIEISLPENTGIDMSAPLFDGVRIDVLSFDIYSNHYKNLGNSEIRRTWIRELVGGSYAGLETLYDNCYIEKADFYGDGTVLVKNSKLGKVDGRNTYDISVMNCNIDYLNYYPRYMSSSIVAENGETQVNGNHTIVRSWMHILPDDYSINLYDCYEGHDSMLDDNLEVNGIDLASFGYLGEDGNVVGIHGGESPFSENPSVPTVDTANSSVEYDSAANKLKVSITVKAD